MSNLLKAYLKDENGQTSTEYILLVAVVAFIVFKFKGVLEDKLFNGDNSVVNKVFGGENFNSLFE